MRYGIISDIHGNLEAFEAAIESLKKESIDQLFCAGDVVGYGADPEECIEKTKSTASLIIGGNHDAAVVGLMDIDRFNESARIAIEWTRNNISEEGVRFLKDLGLAFKNRHIELVHGTLQEPEEFHYMFDKNSASKTFELMEIPVTFVGHTHVPGIFSLKENKIN